MAWTAPKDISPVVLCLLLPILRSFGLINTVVNCYLISPECMVHGLSFS